LAHTMTLDNLSLLSKGGDVTKRRRAANTGNEPTKRRSRKKKAPRELSPEELELQAKKKRAMNKKGIWEVTIDDGVVLGLYQGTPQRIGAFIAAQQSTPLHALNFQLTKITAVPEQIAKERCCERKFTRKDNFCSICGNPKHVTPTIPKGIEVDIFTEVG
jgi:hypothetical protein